MLQYAADNGIEKRNTATFTVREFMLTILAREIFINKDYLPVSPKIKVSP